jgi:hypothetical protein
LKKFSQAEANQTNQKIKKNFGKVFAYQRQVLSVVTPIKLGEMAFLSGSRSWIEGLALVQSKFWQYAHVLLTMAGLFFCLEMSRLMYERLNMNKAELIAYICVLIVMLLNGSNISVHTSWWIFKPPSRHGAKPGQILGIILTTSVIVAYHVWVIVAFVHYAFLKNELLTKKVA